MSSVMQLLERKSAPTKSLAQILRKFLWKGPKSMKVIQIDVFLNADSESPPMT